ncbi:MAG: FAD-dependent oxidoreductase [Bradyrhizobium sp.]|uniref:FAD-dependent oxidoreductase n=1 Tax=Bradyrhizobium sp. TaxID=376 RepID=UPI001DC536DC|nr:FAD-dependent oxidoreductase [Bradyrhizobium sp.]MBV9559614.1 FAD-dependent oxidoreductase [Bradyrhizobium sp.]
MIDRKTRTVRKTIEKQTIDADVCVVGAGAAGIMAALTSARLGRRTVLLEAMPTLGGQLVGTLLGTICGLYSNGPRPRRVTFGAVDEMLHYLDAAKALHARRALNSLVLQYDETICGRWAEEASSNSTVEVVLGAVLREVRMDGRQVTSLHVATRWGDLEVRCKGVVDASGDATVAWHAGLEVREATTPHWGTQMVTIENFDQRAVAEFDGFHVAQVLKEKRSQYGLAREDGFIFAFPGRNVATVNLTHMPNPTDPIGSSRAALEGRDQADRILTFLRTELPSMRDARIRAYGLPGIRQTRWFVSAHQLSIEEVRSGKRPEDAVARCSWPVEAHDTAEGVSWETFDGDDHMHYVPLRSMVHRDADNLIAAGRCIDGDTAALASVRVMGPCFAMGQAAAHALDIRGDRSLHDIDLPGFSARLKPNLEEFRKDPWTEDLREDEIVRERADAHV